MPPNLLDINVKQIRKNSSLVDCTTDDKLTAGDILENKGYQSPVPNDKSNRSIRIAMEQNNSHTQHTKLRNNVKVENLKSKIDFLIMSKTGAPPAPAEEEAEDIQSIQAEINNMLGGKMSPSIGRPAGMDVKNSTKSKSGVIDLTKPPPPAMGGTFQSNRHSPLHSTNVKPATIIKPATTTVEKVEHLLESMFSESKQPSPVKSNIPIDFSSKTITPRQSLEKLSNEAIENILRTPSPVDEDDDEMSDVKPHIRPSLNSSNNKQQPTKPNNNNSRNNITTSSSSSSSSSIISNHHNFDSNHHESTNNHLHPPPSSLSSSYKTPGVISTSKKPPGNVITFSPSKHTRYAGRTRKKSSLSMEDDSSNDSTKLEIIDESMYRNSDESNNHSSENVSSSDKNMANPTLSPNIQRNNRSANRNIRDGSGDNQDVKSNGETNVTSETPSNHSTLTSSTKPCIENKIKQEPINSSPDSSSTIKQSSTAPSKNSITVGTPSKNPVMGAGTPSKNPIMTVENELEKMFAGIVKEEEEEGPTIKLESLATKKENNAETTRKRRTSGERSNRRRSSEFFPSSPEHSTNQLTTPPKKKKKKNPAGAAAVKNNSGNKKKSGSSQGHHSSSNSRHSVHTKDTSNDSTTLNNKASSTSSRIAPFIRVYNNKRKDTTIVNSVAKIRDEDSSSVVASASKKPAGFVPNKKMRSSAQSNLQPANRTDVLDPSWTCVFCKCGPNMYGSAGNPLGDLFGPYRIASPQETYLDGDEFKRRVNRAGSGGGTLNKLDNVKKKRTVSTDMDTNKLTSGLTRVYPDKDSSTSPSTSSKNSVVEYEIWFHEPCIVWGSGCYLVGSALMGLDQCVWSALNSICVNCGESGASIGCVKSKCRTSVHYSCALHIGWYLDPSTFIATCATHRDKYDALRYLPHEEAEDGGSGSEDL